MDDPYWRYRTPIQTAIPDYIPSDVSTISSRPLFPSSHNHMSSSSDFRQNNIFAPYRDRPYGVDDMVGIGVRPESVYNNNTYVSELEEKYLRRRDVVSGPGIPSIVNERPEPLRKADGGSPGRRESSVLFVDGLPTDCTRREVSHLFRPFLGFKEISVVHKEPRHSADKATVLCFVEFTDSKYASTALEALQGYKFDNRKPDLAVLRIHFAHFPFQPPSDRDRHKLPSDRDPHKLPSDRDAFQLPDRDPLKLPSDRDPFQRDPPRLPSDRDPFQRDPPRLPSDRDPFQRDPPRLPSDRDPFQRDPPRLPSDRDPFQLPSDRDPYQLPSDRVEQTPVIPRERGLAIQDEEAMMLKRKYEGSPNRRFERSPERRFEGSPKRRFEGSPGSSKRGKVEASENGHEPRKERKWCIFEGCFRCGKQGHLGKDCTAKPRVCYGCGEHGHKHSNCPTTKMEYSKLNKKGNARGAFKK